MITYLHLAQFHSEFLHLHFCLLPLWCSTDPLKAFSRSEISKSIENLQSKWQQEETGSANRAAATTPTPAQSVKVPLAQSVNATPAQPIHVTPAQSINVTQSVALDNITEVTILTLSNSFWFNSSCWKCIFFFLC